MTLVREGERWKFRKVTFNIRELSKVSVNTSCDLTSFEKLRSCSQQTPNALTDSKLIGHNPISTRQTSLCVCDQLTLATLQLTRNSSVYQINLSIRQWRAVAVEWGRSWRPRLLLHVWVCVCVYTCDERERLALPSARKKSRVRFRNFFVSLQVDRIERLDRQIDQ